MVRAMWELMFGPTQRSIDQFCRAAETGDIKALNHFLQRHGDKAVDLRDSHHSRTALMRAVRAGKFESWRVRDDSAALLLDHGADPNARDADGMTPLMWAAWADRESAASMLIDRGADIALEDPEEHSALVWAAMQDSQNVLHLLLAKGATIGPNRNARETAAYLSMIRERVAEHAAKMEELRKTIPGINAANQEIARREIEDQRARTQRELLAELRSIRTRL